LISATAAFQCATAANNLIAHCTSVTTKALIPIHKTQPIPNAAASGALNSPGEGSSSRRGEFLGIGGNIAAKVVVDNF
jgi:hypothetical protein